MRRKDRTFAMDMQLKHLFEPFGINIQKALIEAELPVTFFEQERPMVNTEEYFRFMNAIGLQILDPGLPIRIALTGGLKTFSPPTLAAYCSENGLSCIRRLEKYKKLSGPIVLSSREDEKEFYVRVEAESNRHRLPEFLIEIEFAFLIQTIRDATKAAVYPVRFILREPERGAILGLYYKCSVEQGDHNEIVFLSQDLQIPFLSRNDTMLDYLEPKLQKHLSTIETDDSYSLKVRKMLIEILPDGQSGINDVCQKMGISCRTLQRKLKEEGTCFQNILHQTRLHLAENYLEDASLTREEISYLLGYEDVRSFQRAFHSWTGHSIGEHFKK